MIAAGQKVVVLADHSKFLRQGLVSFSSFQDVDVLITSELTEEAMVREIERAGVKVEVCPVQTTVQRYDVKSLIFSNWKLSWL